MQDARRPRPAAKAPSASGRLRSSRPERCPAAPHARHGVAHQRPALQHQEAGQHRADRRPPAPPRQAPRCMKGESGPASNRVRSACRLHARGGGGAMAASRPCLGRRRRRRGTAAVCKTTISRRWNRRGSSWHRRPKALVPRRCHGDGHHAGRSGRSADRRWRPASPPWRSPGRRPPSASAATVQAAEQHEEQQIASALGFSPTARAWFSGRRRPASGPSSSTDQDGERPPPR